MKSLVVSYSYSGNLKAIESESRACASEAYCPGKGAKHYEL
jgi:hypothetical protein